MRQRTADEIAQTPARAAKLDLTELSVYTPPEHRFDRWLRARFALYNLLELRLPD
jgi:hypothetical protein